MHYIICATLGYLIGGVSPSYILSKIKKVDIRKSGTKNLGASNTFMHFGRSWGVFVMLFDIFKAFLAVKLCAWLFGEYLLSGLIAGGCSVVGHNYPFYLGFKGGKGLAAFGGWVLGISPPLFLILLILCLGLAFLFNYGFIMAISAAMLFPILAGIKYGSLPAGAVSAVLCLSMFVKHVRNLKRAADGEEQKLRAFIGKYVIKTAEKVKNVK